MKVEIYNDSFQNFKRYQIPKAQLVIADIPYQLGNMAYGSDPRWYVGGDNKNGESELAGKQFFDTDSKAGFRIPEYFHFCQHLLRKEPKKQDGSSPCMIIFCAFQQMGELIEYAAKEGGFPNYIPLVFRKNYSAQVLKANMKIVSNCEYGLLFYRNYLPKFRNKGRMIFNCIDYPRDTSTPKIHPTQKSVPLLEFLIDLFTDPEDVVIDPCAGSGTTLLAAKNLGRNAYGFEIKKDFYAGAKTLLSGYGNQDMFVQAEIEAKHAKYKQLTFA